MNEFTRSLPNEISSDQVMQAIDEAIQSIFQEVKYRPEHSYLTLNGDSDVILPALTRDCHLTDMNYEKLTFSCPYDETDREERRVEWLSAELPGILNALHERSCCLAPSCAARNTSLPSPELSAIQEWAKNGNAGELRNKILGHFHGISPDRVKRLLSEPPKYIPLC
jgi:hypothetical protein